QFSPLLPAAGADSGYGATQGAPRRGHFVPPARPECRGEGHLAGSSFGDVEVLLVRPASPDGTWPTEGAEPARCRRYEMKNASCSAGSRRGCRPEGRRYWANWKSILRASVSRRGLHLRPMAP